MLTAWLMHLFAADEVFRNLLVQNWLLGVGVVTLVIFVETGVVLFPFLPGDSILFATGAVLGVTGINPLPAWAMLASAAVLGDTVNYKVGRTLGRNLLTRLRWVKPRHITRTEEFFERFGGFAIVAGRFVPIVRTLVPFMAGAARMPYSRFILFNVAGGVGWISIFLLAGVWLGHIEWVQRHLAELALVIVAVSLIPVVNHAYQHWSSKTD
jgi:membrane-associated protein